MSDKYKNLCGFKKACRTQSQRYLLPNKHLTRGNHKYLLRTQINNRFFFLYLPLHFYNGFGIKKFIMGRLGVTEILIIVAVILLLFGGKKIPELMKGLGSGIKEFKNAAKDNDQPAAKKEEENKI